MSEEKKVITSLQVIKNAVQILNLGIFPGSVSEDLTVIKQFLSESAAKMEQQADGEKEVK